MIKRIGLENIPEMAMLSIIKDKMQRIITNITEALIPVIC
jgi:hypothetical protein